MKYIVPEYYKNFQCKSGECRHSCCEGWPIRISTKEYYYLLGIKCSDDLRVRLDCALKICVEPSIESYKQITTDWRGICKLHREDGLCAIQVELGESSLPEVCQLYPRSTKYLAELYNCSCSNSCEAVVELLLNFKQTLLFEEKDLSIEPKFSINLSPNKYEYCKKSILIIQDRSLSIPERLINLGNFLNGTDIYLPKPDNLSFAFQLLTVFDQYFESSVSICDYTKASQTYFSIEGIETLSAEDLKNILEKYLLASDHLESILPDWQILFEHLIVNHMFYNNFPYSDNHKNLNDAFLSLTTVYSFLRFNILAYMSDKSTSENLVDYLAAMFRLIEHSNFKHTALHLFKKEKYAVEVCVPQLLYL
ncbi:MAG: flagellin lysine-N-methylase [Mobilitalea sp.]